MGCSFCFKPNLSAESHLQELSEILASGSVDRVTLTGGEPTLVKSLGEIVGRLRKAGIYTSIHTNGLLLDREMINRLKDDVGDFAVPLDSMNQRVQERLRGMDYLPVAKRVIGDLKKAGVRTGIHTVFTNLNSSAIPAIHSFLDGGFDYWKIYEFNPDFVAWFGPDAEESLRRFRDMEELSGNGSPERGGIDSLFGKFLLEDEKIRRHRDKRIQFVSSADPREPYVFLAPDGTVSYTPWFSGKRKMVGNLLEQGIGNIKKKVEAYRRDDSGSYGEEFFDRFNCLPLFARLWEGNFFSEEAQEIRGRYWRGVVHLNSLYKRRMQRLDAA